MHCPACLPSVRFVAAAARNGSLTEYQKLPMDCQIHRCGVDLAIHAERTEYHGDLFFRMTGNLMKLDGVNV